ncbi:hypothetical protein [Fodinicola acaciae]|uniref:hypothetical protein n=1 Tax=Fodinicola acaciae TaxID=2681555 RepID=UPI0013D1D48D|nr:hypothetical protein [Fodinicola acaciae]
MNDSALRSIDAAASTLTTDEHQRAASTLERIIATDPGIPAPTPPRRGRGRRRLAIAALAVLPVAVGGWVLLPKGDDGAAYASWTAAPKAVGGHLDAINGACREQATGGSIDMGRAKIALAERRGEYVAVLYHTDNPDVSAPCLVRNPAGTDTVDVVGFAIGGSNGPAPKAPAEGFMPGQIAQFADGPVSSVTDGVVGSEVVGVTIHAGKLTVQASVENGRYAAWWPGRAFPEGPNQPSGRGGPQEILTYDLTLADGTVVHNAKASRP